MSPNLSREVGWVPGIPRSREVPNVEFEVNRFSSEGWIGLLWPTLPPLSDCLNLLMIAVGRAAQRNAAAHLVRATPDGWSRAALRLLDKNQLPVPPDFGHEITLHRLIRWIDPEARTLVMGVSGSGANLRELEKLGEWFSRAADAACIILTPSAPPPACLTPRAAAGTIKPRTFRSEAERRLFEALRRDESLCGLFEPNVRVLTRFDTAPRVDLLWREGKIIVEIDSYFAHGQPVGFSTDRQRDYETLVSGYLTLRLVHDEITRDCGLAVAKVKRVVDLRKREEI